VASFLVLLYRYNDAYDRRPPAKDDTMEQFKRTTKDGDVLVEVAGAIPATNRWDEYREVRISLPDGQQLVGGVFRDPKQRGGHWSEEAGMIIVQDLNTDQVMAAVDEIIEHGHLYVAFLPMRD
jgi:hypothetical protein